MKPDPLEHQLRQQSFRPLPAEWRGQILAAATAAGRQHGAAPLPIRGWLLGLLYPAPRAWAALGLAWALILVLNVLAVPDDLPRSGAIAEVRALPPVLRLALVEQQRLRAELLGTNYTELPPMKLRRQEHLGPHTMLSGVSAAC